MNLSGFCRFWRRRAARRVLIGASVVLCLFVAVSGTIRALTGSSEFRGFRQIVQVSLVEGKDHYEHVSNVRAYPPFFPIFWAPFGLFPLGQVTEGEGEFSGASVSQMIQAGASAAAVLILMTALAVWAARSVAASCVPEDERRDGRCVPALLLVLSGGLMLNSIVRCETDMFVVMPVAGAMYLMFVRRREATAGVLLGLAAALKLTPGLFAVYLLCQRKWRALAGMAAGGLVCTVVLPALVWGPRGAVERHVFWYDTVLRPYASKGPEEFIGRAYRRANQSLKAATVRYLSRYNAGSTGHPRYVNVADLPAGTVAKVATGLKALILAGLVAMWTLTPARADRHLSMALFALVPPGMLLLSDVSVGGHLAILLIPFGALVAFCFRHEGRRVGTVVSWGVLCAFVVTHLIGVKTLKEMSAGTAGVLMLLGLTSYVALRLRAESAGQGQQTRCP